MNDRLRDRVHDSDPVLARAAELAASVPDIPSSDVRKERVRRAVVAARHRGAWLPLLLRPSLAIAVVLAAGAVMAATLGRESIARVLHQLSGHSSETARPAPAARLSRLRPSATPAEAPAPPSPIADEQLTATAGIPGSAKQEAEPVTSAGPRTAAKPVRDGRAIRVSPRTSMDTAAQAPVAAAPSATAEAPAAPAKAAPAHEAALLMAAVRALRHDRDPARAATLLDNYLRRFPDGVLAEEALAYAIEAASVRGDARASALARSYLQRYPHGRFERAARAVLE
jgi:hypothetical protein